jgi:ankyrin repeat protein
MPLCSFSLLFEKYYELMKNNDGCLVNWSPLLVACKDGRREIVEVLLNGKVKANVHTLGSGGISALCLASMWGHKEIVGMLLDHGAKIDHVDHDVSIICVLTHNLLLTILS